MTVLAEDLLGLLAHETDCDPWAQCRICLIEDLLVLAHGGRWPRRKALAEIPHGAQPHPSWRWTAQHVDGPWPAIQTRIRDAIVETAWEHGERVGLYPGDRPDELLVDLEPDNPRLARWARVRVTVEVLDGMP